VLRHTVASTWCRCCGQCNDFSISIVEELKSAQAAPDVPMAEVDPSAAAPEYTPLTIHPDTYFQTQAKPTDAGASTVGVATAHFAVPPTSAVGGGNALADVMLRAMAVPERSAMQPSVVTMQALLAVAASRCVLCGARCVVWCVSRICMP
jgi:hypothetical protein